MKISKAIWIILGVVVLGVAFGFLYMQYTKQLDEQTQLKAKITANQATVSRLVTERESVQSQLTKLNEQLDQKKAGIEAARLSLDNVTAGWPREAESIEYEEAIFGLAGGWDLDVNVVTAGDAAAKSVQGIGFLNTTFTVEVTGQPLTSGFAEASEYETYIYQVLGNILGFVDALANDKSFAAAQIDVAGLTVPSLLTSEDVVAAGIDLPQPTGTLTVTVYTYKGG